MYGDLASLLDRQFHENLHFGQAKVSINNFQVSRHLLGHRIR